VVKYDLMGGESLLLTMKAWNERIHGQELDGRQVGASKQEGGEGGIAGKNIRVGGGETGGLHVAPQFS